MATFRARELPAELADLKIAVLDAAFRVHRAVGAGFREHVYRRAMAHDLALEGHDAREQVWYPVRYRGIEIPHARQVDLLVGDKIIVELKAVETLLPLHKHQIVSYLRATGKPLGLLVNFNVPLLKDGYQWYRHPDWLVRADDPLIRGARPEAAGPNPKVPPEAAAPEDPR